MAEVKAVADGAANAVTQNNVSSSDTTVTSSNVYRTTTNEAVSTTNETAEVMQAQSSNPDDEVITVNVGKNYDSFNTTMADLDNTAKYPQRGHEAFLINKKTHSSVAIRQNGQINLASSIYSQYKLNPSGKSVEQTLESVVITNRRQVNADDIVFNDHKLNPYLYMLTDMRKLNTVYNEEIFIGNFCMYGSVLVKAWEPDLKRYVLIRRPIRIPMFSPLLNVPEIHAGIGVTDPLKIDEDILVKSDKGFQVNKVYTDSQSLIGKEGQDGEGIQRAANVSIAVGNVSMVDGEIVSDTNINTTGSTAGGSTNEEKIWSFFKVEGFSDVAAAGVMGNIARESSYDPTAINGGGSFDDTQDGHAYGLIQWYTKEGKQGLSAKAKALGGKVSDLHVQLAYIKDFATSQESSVTGVHNVMPNPNKKTAWEMIKATTSYESIPDGSTCIWHDYIEKAHINRDDYDMSERIKFAKAAYEKHKGKTYINDSTASTNPAVTTPVTSLTNVTVTMLGDSIGAGMQDNKTIQQLIPKIDMHVKGSMGIAWGLEQAKKITAWGDIVVVELGTNNGLADDQTQGQAKQLLDLIGKQKTVYWCTTYNGQDASYNTTGYIKKTNDWIKALPNSYSNVKIIDWFALISQHTDWLSDKLHCTTEGYTQYANLIANSIKSSGSTAATTTNTNTVSAAGGMSVTEIQAAAKKATEKKG